MLKVYDDGSIELTKILRNFGVPLAILTGDYTKDHVNVDIVDEEKEGVL